MNKREGMGAALFKGMILPGCAFALLMLYQALDSNPVVDRFYTLGLSRWILRSLSALTAWLPISAAELVAVALALIFLGLSLRLIRALLLGKGILATFFSLTNLVSGLLILFLILWGFNYRQQGLAYTMDLPPAQEVSRAEAKLLLEELISQAAQERAAAGFNDDMPFRFRGNLISSALEAYDQLSQDYPQFAHPAGQPKPLLSSRLFSYLGISGIFIPFTAEANFNRDQPDLLLPAAILHELAHLKGVSREGEANFMAYLASRYSNDPELRYSGTMLALIHSANTLSRIDPQAREAAALRYTEGMKRDLREYNGYWQQFEGKLQERSREVNDRYLKANGQEEGVATYEDMVGYLISFGEKQNR